MLADPAAKGLAQGVCGDDRNCARFFRKCVQFFRKCARFFRKCAQFFRNRAHFQRRPDAIG